MEEPIPFTLVFLAGGKGARVGGETAKQYLLLRGEPLAWHALRRFLNIPGLEHIVIVCDHKNCDQFLPILTQTPLSFSFAPSGSSRQASLHSGITSLTGNPLLCIHDAVRPFFSISDVLKVIRAGSEVGAAALGVPVSQTIKICDSEGFVANTPPRHQLWEIQTPQVAYLERLKIGFEKANQEKYEVTDDVSLVEKLGDKVQIVLGSRANVKITYPEDLLFAEVLLKNAFCL